MRTINDIYGRRYLLSTSQQPELAIPWFHQEKKGEGPWKLWAWQLVYARANIYVDHTTAKELITDGTDLDAFVRELSADMNAAEVKQPRSASNLN